MNYPFTHPAIPPNAAGSSVLESVHRGFGPETVGLLLSIVVMAGVVWLLALLLDQQNQSVDLEVRRSMKSRRGRYLVRGT